MAASLAAVTDFGDPASRGAAQRGVHWPQLRDPADEMVLEAAINGGADALVTFNRKDFGQVPARFGIALLPPQDALRRLP